VVIVTGICNYGLWYSNPHLRRLPRPLEILPPAAFLLKAGENRFVKVRLCFSFARQERKETPKEA
jgi:hypothetical protein